jgi:hypothetical protein
MDDGYISEITKELVASVGPKAVAGAEKASRATILSHGAAECMTFVTPMGRRISPAASAEYVKALICFVRQTDYNGAPLDSAISDPIVKATENALVEALNSDAARDAIVRAVIPSGQVNQTVGDAVDADAQRLVKDLLALSGVDPVTQVGAHLTAQAADRATDILQSSTGKAVIAAVAHFAATTQGKVILTKLITMAGAKIAASTMFKSIIVGALKHMSLGVVVKLVLVKLLALAIPALVTAHIPIFWVIMPVVVAFTVYEMVHIPQKLADKVPPQIGAEIEKSFPKIAEEFAKLVMADIVATMSKKAA